ncbi:ADP-L-glycero-D-manno-heptose-6-epimerase [Candidatus Kaiserbacteria bacterium RIFCSPHIGHO2_02_FULL_59_21]|uniref:ADP-L-glycero-D-mannoheptose-6-epimerase n=2 Tax=Candidatus Kaiseribacteriota TaxID=1752734 RepID=A0A0G1YVF8_9BACT|nr:MAG: ADP-L-glycero-D-mannoheptose-6-epimerase [Candidatus Kaiserbacteria bacterium GW2011_GWA2_58_9]OGG63104.1 MAG: ADP-L-glycero-D-manno-heptose-6-epimerase [Candidatus Kaiserbacteria bacterium RIFCSPHIGHO2_01_FULL_58_22]OGG66588.1 MAG: ADP-L-glycero-D-manno-heptose-6-epimerase [Candidatus Kaiserbacteria bacterium RIFCSPHIGHO2_02_FULL_59_21]OGG80063.1 MAG: ADP-L-glycero-D-manno-heptose-6-epimerase [Candidatus Kaiserbacteria bacterium RIFCSPLOWO2_01_FULL_59_34]
MCDNEIVVKTKGTVIVTGGAGLIGPSLIELLLPRYRVVSLDNYFIGRKENHIEGAEYVEGHTRDIEALLGHERPVVIYQLGEYSRVEQSFKDIELVWESNVHGAFRVFEYWRRRGCKLVYAGSSTKFADGGLGRDQSPYAWMKASNTELVENYGAWFDLPYAITYFYNAYGPRELSEGPYASVMGIFKKKYRAGEPITVVAPGTQKRNFTHVEDIARGLFMVGEKGQGDEYGIGSPESYSVLELAKMFTDNVVMLPERKGNRMESIVDTSRVEKEFGWKPEHSVREYVESLKRENAGAAS